MSKLQPISAEKMGKMLEQHNIWSKIHSGELLAVMQSKGQAKISKGGTSYVISYYDKQSRYICTIHRIVNKQGHTIHEHVKDVSINGIHYKEK